MDIDAFIAAHSAEWSRLSALSSRSRRLTGAESDELVLLYRRVATHLALVQSRTPDPVLSARLSTLLAGARAAAVGGSRNPAWAAFGRGVLVSIPVALYRTWRWWVTTAVASVGASAAMMLWLRAHPDRLARVIPSADLKQLVDHDFRDYYSQHSARSFDAQVWTNNALVAAIALFAGVTIVGTLYVLFQNTINIGIDGGAMLGTGHSAEFFGLILPHGILELTAVFIASGIGLRTGWAWIAPGALPRSQSLAAAGRVAAVVALGLVGVLAVSGAIEAFVTPSGLPTAIRIGIGVLAEIVFLSYVVILGRRGVWDGATGDIDVEERGDLLPVA